MSKEDKANNKYMKGYADGLRLAKQMVAIAEAYCDGKSRHYRDGMVDAINDNACLAHSKYTD